MNILCADDDPDIRAVLELAFAIDPLIRAEVVESGEDAIARARRGGYDLFVLDGWMPGLDGYDTCALLKKDPATSSVPVVFLTANSDRTQLERALACGAVGTLPKPFDPTTLVSELRAIVG